MTLAQLKDRIMSWPENTMNFRITDVFSWRGSYIEPACSISTELTSKADNLKMIDKLLSNTFMGWKGGKYTYHQWDDVNFEEADSSWSNGQYLIDFILNYGSTSIVKHIFGNDYED